jgi:phosphatidyl-myo-inositol dimannoside synthase
MARILVAAATLAPGQGGIASVARMTRHALEMSGHTVSALSYLDDAAIGEAARATAARGSKVLFAVLVHGAAIGCRSMIFDSAGLARARLRLPGVRRPYAVWMHGVEAWEDLRPEAEASLRGAALVLVNSKYTLARFERLHGVLP